MYPERPKVAKGEVKRPEGSPARSRGPETSSFSYLPMLIQHDMTFLLVCGQIKQLAKPGGKSRKNCNGYSAPFSRVVTVANI